MAKEDSISNAGVRVKEEHKDEAEIDKLALEMAEKNKQKLISQATQIAQQTQMSQQALQKAGGQQMITYYFNRDKNKDSSDSLLPKKVEEKKKGTIDEESQRGRFGWYTVRHEHIPLLFRREEKYCAVRMVELKLLNRYLSFLPHEVTSCIHIRSYFITENEAKLLNEINSRHCEFQFGRELFTTKDLVVRLFDACCFLLFLETCFKKLVQKSMEPSEHCGFVRINGGSVVPYTVKDSVKYVPLFYFEGETDTLKLKAKKIDNWELAYLKFCCKVQGIRNELFASDTCSVVSLDDVKMYFPSGTKFEDWWPQKIAEPMRVVSHQLPKGGTGSWIQKPSQQYSAPVSSVASNKPSYTSMHYANKHSNSVAASTSSVYSSGTSLVPPSLSSHSSNIPTYQNSFNQFYSHWPGQASSTSAAGYSSNVQALLSSFSADPRSNLQLPSQLMSNIPVSLQNPVRPPPLLRTSNSHTSPVSTSPVEVNNSADSSMRLAYAAGIHQNSVLPILGSYSSSAAVSSINNTPAHNASNSCLTSQPKGPPPLLHVANGMCSDNFSSHKGVGRNGIDKYKLLESPVFRPDPTQRDPPYKVGKMKVDGRDILYINHIAYVYTGSNARPMVSIQDIIKTFFPEGTLSECLEVFQNVLSVSVFKANWHQVYELMRAWGTKSNPTDVVPLVCGESFKEYLSQIKYIFLRRPSLAQQQAKRIRIT